MAPMVAKSAVKAQDPSSNLDKAEFILTFKMDSKKKWQQLNSLDPIL